MTAALLHDVGMALLSDEFKHEHFAPALTDLGDVCAVERELIDVDHANVGFVLAEHWDLPDSICGAIKSHHMLDGDESDLARAVHLSDLVSEQLVPDSALVFAPATRFDETVETLGIDAPAMLERATQRLEWAGFELWPREGSEAS